MTRLHTSSSSSSPSPSPVAFESSRDRGAALIVAIGFVVMIGMMGAGLTSMITSGVGNRIALEEIRDVQYAADGAVEETIATIRAGVDAATIGCDTAVAPGHLALNGVAIRVDASVLCGAVRGADGLPVVQVNATFRACVDAGVACAGDAVVVHALVGFERDPSGDVARSNVRSWSVLR